MKKVMATLMILLTILSTFAIITPQVKAESDHQLTTNPLSDTEPSWSPGGAKIVYHAYAGSWYRHIWVMNNDGTGKIQLTSGSVVDVGPAYSPDGTKIAFARHGFRGDYMDLMIMDADGSNVQPITFSGIPGKRAGSFTHPRWSKDGTKLLFDYMEGTTGGPYFGMWIGTINVDGIGLQVLGQGMEPKFCYGDTKILFNTDEHFHADGQCIALMNADGTGRQILTDGPMDMTPDMSSITNRIVFTRYTDLYIMNEDGTNIEPIPSGEMSGYPEWSPDEKYIVYKSAKSGNEDIWKMEAPPACTWFLTTPLPMPSCATGDVVHDNRIYVVGGQTTTPGVRSNKVIYASVQPNGHIDTDGWQFTTQLPEERGNPGIIVYNDWIYVLGGSASQPGWIERDTVWYASFNVDGTIGSWMETTRLPYHGDKTASVEWNGRIYIMTGWDGGSAHDDVYYAEIQADGSLGDWIETTSLPEARTHGQRAVVHNGIIYFMGGCTGRTGQPTTHNEVYYATIQASGEVGPWTKTASLPVGLYHFSTVIQGEDIFVMGGTNQSLLVDDKVYKAHINADGSLDSWQEWCRLPEPLRSHSSVVLNGRIYVIGGERQDASLVDTVYFTTLPAPVDWNGIKERAQKRKQLYELYQEAFSPSWWEDTSDALVSQLYGGEEDSLKSVSKDLLESLIEVLPSYVGILNSAYQATAGLITIFSSLEALKYEIVADVLYQASLRYDVLADLAALVEKAELVAAAAEAHDLEALMDSLGQEKGAMEKLYQGTVEYEKGIWYYLATVPPPRLPPPPPEGILLTYMNEHIYLMLVRYPYYYALDREFTLDVRDGQLISLRFELEANYLDVTNSLGDLNHLDEAVNAPLTTRYVAPLAERGYWTVNGEEKTKAKAGDICTANVVLKPYDLMAVSGTITVEVFEKYVWLGIPYYEPFMTHEEEVELTPGGFTTVLTPPFTADPPPNKPRFRGYHMNVKFSGEGIRNSDEEEGLVDVEVNWEADPPDLLVPPAVIALFTLASPANLLVTAPDGLRVGYDSSTGTVVNEIEGATYSGPGTEPQVITIPYPLPGVYIVDVFGTGMGTYTLTMEFEAPDGSIITGTYTGEIVQGAYYVYTATLTYEEIITSPNPIAELEHLKDFINELPDDSFDKPRLGSQRKNALFNKIDEVILKVEAGNYTDAINKLVNDIRAKMDGASTVEDWVIDPETQFRLCVTIDHIISSIETLQQA